MELDYKTAISPWPFLTTEQVSWFCVSKLKVGPVEESAALMTSDRGTDGGAELNLNTPVTPKSPGLNPNASVFLSKTPPSNHDNQWEEESSHSTESSDAYQLVNGDVGKSDGGVVYPPTPEVVYPPTPEVVKSDGGVVYPPTPETVKSDGGVVYPPTPETVKSEGGLVYPPTPEGGVVYPPTPEAVKSDGAVVYPPTPESPASSNAEYPTAPESALPNQVVFTPVESNGNTEESGPLESSMPAEQLRGLLRAQLEYYFSRDNLSHDNYLVSQMDSDQYVPILTVANFNQVKRLTNNMELIVSVLRELANVQVDEKGERVRPNHNRCIVILREVPEATPLKDVENLFSGENCPRFVSCEFAHNDSWYVTFESDETAQRAYQYLREDVKTFLGKPIMARIKAKTLIRTTIYRNGVKPQGYEQTQSYPLQQQTQQHSPQSQQQRYNFPSVPLQYMNGGQQQFQPQFQHYNIMAAAPWPPIYDPSMVFAINGYQAQSVKITQNTDRPNFNRPRSINQKQRSERSSESRISHESRYGGSVGVVWGSGSHRTSPRSLDGSQSSGGGGGNPPYHRRESGSGQAPQHMHHPPVPAHLDAAAPTAMPMPHQSVPEANNKDQSLMSQRGQRSYRSRRRREDEATVGARNSRTTSSQVSTKDGKGIEPQFELESNSFPPLPGASNNSATGDIFENKLSDVVKGTARPGPKEVVTKATQQVATPSSPTTKEACTATMVTTIAPTPASNNNNNNQPMVSATTTTPVTSSTATTTNSAISMSSLAGSLPTPPPSPEKMETKTEQKYESRPEKSQKNIQSHSATQSHHSSNPQSHAAVVGNTESKSIERETHSVSKHSSNQRSISLEERQPVRLSYAQMVQRRSESENGTSERAKSDETTMDVSNSDTDQQSHKSHTLKEQSQTARQAPANARLPVRDHLRKDSDPKEQRPFVNRRAKENRERRVADRRRDREFEGRRSPNK